LDSMASWRSGRYNQVLMSVLQGRDAADFVDAKRSGILAEDLAPASIARLIHLMLLTLNHMKQQSPSDPEKE